MFTVAWHSIKLHPFIQFEWPPWEFKFSWNSCILHDHCIVLLILYWLYRAVTSIATPFCQFYAYLSVFFVRLCFQFLDHCDKLIHTAKILVSWFIFIYKNIYNIMERKRVTCSNSYLSNKKYTCLNQNTKNYLNHKRNGKKWYTRNYFNCHYKL